MQAVLTGSQGLPSSVQKQQTEGTMATPSSLMTSDWTERWQAACMESRRVTEDSIVLQRVLPEQGDCGGLHAKQKVAQIKSAAEDRCSPLILISFLTVSASLSG